MNISEALIQPTPTSADRREGPSTKEETAIEFERVFALHLVEEMTDGLFDQQGNSIVGNSGNFYRDFITGTLADELAAQKKLGMADLIMKHWKENGIVEEQGEIG